MIAFACTRRAADADGDGPAPAGGAPAQAGGAGAPDLELPAAGESGQAGGEGGLGGGTSAAGAAGDGVSAAGAAGLGGGGAPGDEDCELLYTEGHGDVFVDFEDGLSVRVRAAFEGGSTETVEPAERVCVVVSRASRELAESLGGAPEDARFGFLGLPTGEAFWLLPASPRAGMPWLGASTEAVPQGQYLDDQVTLTVEVEAPAGGELAVWMAGTFGDPSVLWATATQKLAHTFSVGAHVHFNWAFTRPGRYALVLRARGATLGSLAQDVSEPARLRFLVRP